MSCQHRKGSVSFCIHKSCSEKDFIVCADCMKNKHCHSGKQQVLTEEDIAHKMDFFHFSSECKPKCRTLQECIQSYFNGICLEISQILEIVSKNLINAIGYPLLFNNDQLSTYKRLRNKEFQKIEARKFKEFCEFSDSLLKQSVQKTQQKYYQQQCCKAFRNIEKIEEFFMNLYNQAKNSHKLPKHNTQTAEKIKSLTKQIKNFLEQKSKIAQNSALTSHDYANFKTDSINKDLKQNKSQEHKNHLEQSNLKIHRRLSSIDNLLKQKNTVNREPIVNSYEQVSTNYQSQEREICQRKERLMKLIDSQEKISSREKPHKGEHLTLQQENSHLRKPQHDSASLKQVSTDQSLSQPSSQKNALLAPPPQLYSSYIPKKTLQAKNKGKQIDSSFQRQMPNAPSHTQESFYNYRFAQTNIPQIDQYEKGIGQNKRNSSSNYAFCRQNFNRPQMITLGVDRNLDFRKYQFQERQQYDMASSSPLQRKSKKFHSQAVGEDMSSKERLSSALYFRAESVLLANRSQAINYLQSSLSHHPLNLSAAALLSFLYFEEDRPKQCLDLCNEVLSNFTLTQVELSQLYDIVCNKAASLNCLGRYSETIKLLERFSLSQKGGKLLKNLGDAYFLMTDYEQCLYYYIKCVEQNPNEHEAIYNCSVALFMQQNFHNAQFYIAKAVKKCPGDKVYLQLEREIHKKLQNRGLLLGQEL